MRFFTVFTFFPLLKSLLFHHKPWFPKTHHIWWNTAGCFSHKASEATIVHALQQLKMQKVWVWSVPRQLVKEYWKNCMGAALNFLTQHEEDENYLGWGYMLQFFPQVSADDSTVKTFFGTGYKLQSFLLISAGTMFSASADIILSTHQNPFLRLILH